MAIVDLAGGFLPGNGGLGGWFHFESSGPGGWFLGRFQEARKGDPRLGLAMCPAIVVVEMGCAKCTVTKIIL
jgi:hypothetical protein